MSCRHIVVLKFFFYIFVNWTLKNMRDKIKRYCNQEKTWKNIRFLCSTVRNLFSLGMPSSFKGFSWCGSQASTLSSTNLLYPRNSFYVPSMFHIASIYLGMKRIYTNRKSTLVERVLRRSISNRCNLTVRTFIVKY